MSIFMSDAYVNIYKDPHHTHYKSHLPVAGKVGFPKFMLNELSVPCCVHRILEVLHRTDGE